MKLLLDLMMRISGSRYSETVETSGNDEITMAREEAKRSCLGCRTVKNKEDLLRFVLTPERVLVPDLLFKLPGRGAYICRTSHV